MKIIKHLKSDWFRYGFETLAVIVGILAAFALESWRDSLEVKKEEHEILVNLLNDLKEAESQSEKSIAEETASRKHLIWALLAKAGGDSLPSIVFSDSIIYDVIWDIGMNAPVINTYSDMKNTGKAGLISNEKIRQSFTSLELSINNVLAQVNDRLRVQQLRIDEIVVNDLNYVRLTSLRIPEIPTSMEAENDYRILLADQRIRNLIAIKLNLTIAVLRYRLELHAEIKSLITMLEDEIAFIPEKAKRHL